MGKACNLVTRADCNPARQCSTYKVCFAVELTRCYLLQDSQKARYVRADVTSNLALHMSEPACKSAVSKSVFTARTCSSCSVIVFSIVGKEVLLKCVEDRTWRLRLSIRCVCVLDCEIKQKAGGANLRYVSRR